MKENNDNKLENQLDQDRLFGDTVDLYLNFTKCKILRNVASQNNLDAISDIDLWESYASLLTQNDISCLLMSLVPAKTKRQQILNTCKDRVFRGTYNARIIDHLFENLCNRNAIWNFLKSAMEKLEKEYANRLSSKDYRPKNLHKNIMELQTTLELSDNETAVVLAAFMIENRLLDLGDFGHFGNFNSCGDLKKLAIFSGLNEIQVAKCLSTSGNLRKYCIIDEDSDINKTFSSYLAGCTDQPLNESLWQKYTGEILPWEYHGSTTEQHGNTLIDMIKSKPENSGISILLYGSAGSGKTSFAISLGHKLNRDIYFISSSFFNERFRETSYCFRYSALEVAQRQLDPEKSIIIIDECDEMLEGNDNFNGAMTMFMHDDLASRKKGLLNTAMDNNRHTIIWICNSKQEAIAKSSRRRFDYAILFDELLPETRRKIWENSLKHYGCENKLSDKDLSNISHTYKINAGGIAIAIKNTAAISSQTPDIDFISTLDKFLQSHCNLLDISPSRDSMMEPSSDYSLEGLNIKSGISPERIIQACQNFLKSKKSCKMQERDRPRMNILLHGVPGSGKTEFIKYLAKRLGRKLNVKNGSDLLSMYVGGTEHLLAKSFMEAEKQNAILFIDEGDSMLAPRNSAYRTWEVSQVNALLTEMENFNGIFAVSTNLIQRIDPAAFRRFTFRMHFDFLDNKGKLKFYQTYFGHLNLPELNAEEIKSLENIQRLTPSDYRNVRQQLFYLSCNEITNSEIISALEQECQSKYDGNNFKGLGEERHHIGFDS